MMMIVHRTSPTTQLQHAFHSKHEAKEYAQLFLSDLCFWEQTMDKQPSSGQQSQETSSVSSTESVPNPHENDLRWKTAVDPVTGRTYYYDSVTRETQWDKPAAMKSWERQQKQRKRKKERSFFREMESNILASLRRGELIPGVPAEATKSMQSPGRETNNNKSVSSSSTISKSKHSVRTISGMDERVLASLGNHENSHNNNNNGASQPSLPRVVAPPRVASQHSPENRNPANSANVPGRPPLPLSMSRNLAPASHEKPFSDRMENRSVDKGGDEEQRAAPPSGGSGGAVPATNSHMRRNTGGTIFAKSTMINPDVKATIKCVCGVFRAHIVQGQERRRQKRAPVSPNTVHVNLGIFKDDHELARPRRGLVPMPTIENIATFYYEYFRRSQMEHDTIIMSLIYVERLIKETNGTLAPTTENWRSLLFSCMILASKVWDDLSMWNVDFSNVSVATGITPFSLGRINELELAILTCLGFDVRVPASEYAKYYFLIRTMLIRGGLLENAAAPLSKEEAKIFEQRTSQYQNARLDKLTPKGASRRTHSFDWEWFSRISNGGQNNKQRQQYNHSSATINNSNGPVLVDKLCLEQIVSQ